MSRARPHPFLLAALAITLVYGGVAAWKRANRPPGRWVGITNCTWTTPPTITIRPGLRPIDSIATFAHESVHAAACKELGPLRYRWATLRAKSNLALEVPAYCAGARSRMRQNGDTMFVRITMPIDMMAAMGDDIDSATIARSIAESCPELAATSARRYR
jgi:hypothetical protein